MSRDPAKAAALGELFQSYAKELGSSGRLPALLQPSPLATPLQGSQQEDSPELLVWTLYYLAQHHDHLG